MLGFTNCGPSLSSQDDPPNEVLQNLANSNYNGGGYSGKLTYAHYELHPSCASGSTAPERFIELFSGQAQLTENQCSTSSQIPIDTRDILSNAYDPYYLVHDDLIYINQSLLPQSSTGHRHVIHAICSNPAYEDSTRDVHGVDIAIRFEQIWMGQTTGQWQTTTSAHLIFGRGQQPALESQEPGRLRESRDPSAQAPFTSDSSTLRLDFAAGPSATRGPGTLQLASGEVINMNCFFLRPR